MLIRVTAMSNEISYLLTMENMVKSFGNTKALDNVTLKLKRSSIHALMGENGAGKSHVAQVGHYKGA